MSCSVAGVAVCGPPPKIASYDMPSGRLVGSADVAVAAPAGSVGVTSTATRLVYLLTR